MPNKQNVAAVEQLKDKLGRAQVMLVGEYRGLTVADMAALRNAVRGTDAEVIIAKNTLTRIAAGELGISGLDEFLGGPVALTLGYDDPVATAKALNDFLKGSKRSLALRGGLLGETRLDAADLERVASTPSREQSIARIMGGLNAPAGRIAGALTGVMRNIAYILGQVAAGQGTAGGAAEA